MRIAPHLWHSSRRAELSAQYARRSRPCWIARSRSVAGSQPGVAARVVCPIEAVVADRLARERRRADDDDCQMVGRLRWAELVALALQDLAAVRRQRVVLQIGQVRE